MMQSKIAKNIILNYTLWDYYQTDGVHSHNRHLYGLLEACKRKGFEDVYIHAFMDGRDTPPASGEMYITELKDKMLDKGIRKNRNNLRKILCNG